VILKYLRCFVICAVFFVVFSVFCITPGSMAGREIDLRAFPKLNLSGNVAENWKSWYAQFSVAVEMTSINLGKEEVGAQEVEVFRGRKKLLALLCAVGSDGMDTLTSLGFDVAGNNDDNAFEEAINLLRGQYCRDESFYVKTIRFVTVSQAAGEGDMEYLLRIEKLSRAVEFGADNNELRLRFCVALAVNGLTDASTRKELLQVQNLTWDQLRTTLTAKTIGKESESLMSEARSGGYNRSSSIKTEVDEVRCRPIPYSPMRGKSYRPKEYFDTQNISNERGSYEHSLQKGVGRGGDWRERVKSDVPMKGSKGCFGCGSSSHFLRNCPDARCFACSQIGHTVKDCRRKNVMYGEERRDCDVGLRESESLDSNTYRKRSYGRRDEEGRYDKPDLRRSTEYVGGDEDEGITKYLDVNDVKVEFKFDTGANVSTVSVDTAELLGLTYEKPEMYLTGADGSNLKVVGMSKVTIASKDRRIDTNVYVLEGAKQNLLGLNELRRLELIAVIGCMRSPSRLNAEISDGQFGKRTRFY